MSQLTITPSSSYSQWFDQSNNANKLRQSYLKGFLDVSGGGILLRSDNSLNFYTGTDTVPKLGFRATDMVVWMPSSSETPALVKSQAILDPVTTISGSSSTYYDISNTKLVFIKDLSENVQIRLNDLRIRTQFQQIDPTAQSTYFVTDA